MEFKDWFILETKISFATGEEVLTFDFIGEAWTNGLSWEK